MWQVIYMIRKTSYAVAKKMESVGNYAKQLRPFQHSPPLGSCHEVRENKRHNSKWRA